MYRNKVSPQPTREVGDVQVSSVENILSGRDQLGPCLVEQRQLSALSGART